MGTIKVVLVLLFALLLASNIVYAQSSEQQILQSGSQYAELAPAKNVPSASAALGMLHNVSMVPPSNENLVRKFITTYEDYLFYTPPDKRRMVSFSAISNQPDGVATYSHGNMNYDVNAGTLTGQGSQYFSNRLWAFPVPGEITIPKYPFNPNITDTLRLTLGINGAPATLTLLSKGNTQETIRLQFSNNVLYGFTNTSPAALFVISLQKFEETVQDDPR